MNNKQLLREVKKILDYLDCNVIFSCQLFLVDLIDKNKNNYSNQVKLRYILNELMHKRFDTMKEKINELLEELK